MIRRPQFLLGDYTQTDRRRIADAYFEAFSEVLGSRDGFRSHVATASYDEVARYDEATRFAEPRRPRGAASWTPHQAQPAAPKPAAAAKPAQPTASIPARPATPSRIPTPSAAKPAQAAAQPAPAAKPTQKPLLGPAFTGPPPLPKTTLDDKQPQTAGQAIGQAAGGMWQGLKGMAGRMAGKLGGELKDLAAGQSQELSPMENKIAGGVWQGLKGLGGAVSRGASAVGRGAATVGRDLAAAGRGAADTWRQADAATGRGMKQASAQMDHVGQALGQQVAPKPQPPPLSQAQRAASVPPIPAQKPKQPSIPLAPPPLPARKHAEEDGAELISGDREPHVHVVRSTREGPGGKPVVIYRLEHRTSQGRTVDHGGWHTSREAALSSKVG